MLVLAGVAHAATPDAEIMAPIQKFMDTFNKGDAAGAAATHLANAELSITDEVPPYVWRGPQAFSAWAAALESHDKKAGISDERVTIAAPTRIETSGDGAYVVVPAVYSFKQGAAAMSETAQMTFVVKKGASGWLIQAWTWTGPKPVSAAHAKP
jgi:ketosteroid isomerase-like protein